jgi:purine nucleoside phosphorylase
MSTVWESMALRHAGADVAAVSVISNMGAGLQADKVDHSQVEAEVAKVASPLVAAIFDFAAEEI